MDRLVSSCSQKKISVVFGQHVHSLHTNAALQRRASIVYVHAGQHGATELYPPPHVGVFFYDSTVLL